MADFDRLLKSYDVRDLLDEIASADPPSYLRRCFAEGRSAAHLSFARVQQLAVCAMVVDAISGGREYAPLEPELISDWRAHYLAACVPLKEPAAIALRRAREQTEDAAVVAELDELIHRLAPNS